MKITVDDPTVGGLLTRGDLVFRVPVYQRPYSWGIDQWNDLWDDVMEGEEGVHFIGSVVMIKKGAELAGFNELEVVDGQQRITTLSILFCALRDCCREGGGAEIADDLDRMYLNSSLVGKRSRKIFLGRVDDKAYDDLLQGRITEEHSVCSAYEYFKERIQSHGKYDDIAARFTTRVNLVSISAENAEDAFKLFETLNDRGLDLSAVDLIKNYILSGVAKKQPDQLNAVIEIWDEVVTNLENLDKIRFFRQFLLARDSGKVSAQTLYPLYRTRIEREDDIPQWAAQLAMASDYYERIHEQTFKNERLNRKLRDLINQKATGSFILILRMFMDKWTPARILAVIPAIEAFSLRRAICAWSTSEMDTIYNQLATWEGGPPEPDLIRRYLAERTPKDNEFRQKFQLREFRQDNQTKYVLEQLEYGLTETTEKIVAGRQEVHIEHIMPLSITTKKSRDQHGGDWVSYLGEDASRHREYARKVGNLTLLGSELNVRASNNPFNAKKSIYEKSDVLLTRELVGYPTWNVCAIEERGRLLAERAINIWRV